MVLEDKFDFECGVRSKQLYKHIEEHLASYHSSRKEFGSPKSHSSVRVQQQSKRKNEIDN